MNNTIKLKKVDAEVVNDFEFKKDKNGVHDSSFRAKVSVKVVNAIREVHFHVADSWEKRNNGGREIVMDADDRFSKQLKEVGLLASYTKVKAAYKEALKKARAEREKAIEDARGKEYDESWVHEFAKETNGMCGVKVFVNTTREKYVKEGYSLRVRAKIGEKEVVIEQVSHGDYSSKKRFEFSDSDLTPGSYRKIWSMDAAKLIAKFSSLHADFVAREASQKEAHEEEQKHKKALVQLLRKAVGKELKFDLGWEYSRYSRRSYRTLEVVLGERKIPVSADRELKSFTLKGISDLTLDQVAKIIKALQ